MAAVAMLVAGVAVAQTANSIDQVTVSRGSSGNTIVRFQMRS